MKFLLIVGMLMSGCTLCMAQDRSVTVTEMDGISALPVDPLYVVSSMKTAKIITRDQFDKISTEDIDYVKMLDDPASIYIYGDKAKNGVMLIVLKDNSFFERYSTKKRRHK